MRHWSLIAVLGVLGCQNSQAEIPKNAIVSTSLCADTYLLALPETHARVAAMSWQSRSSLSRAPSELRSLPQLDDDLERLHNWSDATIISSSGGKGDIDLSWGEDFETVWDNFSTLASALDTPNPSSELQARLDALPPPKKPLRLLYLDRSGATAGPDTFVHAVFQSVGAENVVTQSGWQSPDTETLLQLDPDAIVTSFMGSNYASVNDRTVHHKSLAEKIDALPEIDIPGGVWPCAGPGLVEAAEILSRELVKL